MNFVVQFIINIVACVVLSAGLHNNVYVNQFGKWLAIVLLVANIIAATFALEQIAIR